MARAVGTFQKPGTIGEELLNRIVLDLKCIKCGTLFKRSFENKRGKTYSEGEMVRLEKGCPEECGSEWFAVEKQHSIRKFKRHYRDS